MKNNGNNFQLVDDYICKSFNAARKANPNIELYYNDYGQTTSEKKGTYIYDYLKALKDKGCAIDGIGFQNHITLDFYTKLTENIATLRALIKKYAAAGMKVHITETDVGCKGFGSPDTC